LFVQAVANGVVLGSLFALLGIGLTLTYGVMEVPNFAQAGVITLSAYAMLWLNQSASWPFWLAVLGGLVVGGLLSVLTERVAYRFVRTRPLAAPVVALGMLLVLDNTALMLFGGDHVSLSPPYAGDVIYLGPASVPAVGVALIATAAVALLALHIFLRRTRTGRAIRAVSQNAEAAATLGIRLERQYVISFFISGILAGLAAFAYGPMYAVFPYMADAILLNAFVVVVLGGLGNVGGAAVSGLLLGLLESFGAVYVSAAYQTLFGFAVLLLMIVLRPSGLFSNNARRIA
jgi:branched-chain amino acid transport system permease protein